MLKITDNLLYSLKRLQVKGSKSLCHTALQGVVAKSTLYLITKVCCFISVLFVSLVM